MASDTALAGLAAFGTGILQGYTTQQDAQRAEARKRREEKRAEAAQRRQYAFRVKLDEQMRLSREKTDQARALRAAEAIRASAGSFDLSAPTNTLVTGRNLAEHDLATRNELVKSLIGTGMSLEDAMEVAEDQEDRRQEQRQNRYNRYLTHAYGLLQRGQGNLAAQNYVEALKHNAGPINAIQDPETGLLQNVDDDLNPVGAPYALTTSDIADRLMEFPDLYREHRINQQNLLDEEFRTRAADLAERKADFDETIRMRTAARSDATETRLAEQAAFNQQKDRENLARLRDEAARSEYRRTSQSISDLLGLKQIDQEIKSVYDEQARLGAIGIEMPGAEAQRQQLEALQQTRQEIVGLSQAIAATRVVPENRTNVRSPLNELTQLLREAMQQPRTAVPSEAELNVRDSVKYAEEVKESKAGYPIAAVSINGVKTWVTRDFLEMLRRYGVE